MKPEDIPKHYVDAFLDECFWPVHNEEEDEAAIGPEDLTECEDPSVCFEKIGRQRILELIDTFAETSPEHWLLVHSDERYDI